MPTRNRTLRIFFGSAQMSLPSSSTWPPVGRSRPLSHLDEGRLSAARVADHPQKLPLLHLDGDLLHGGLLKGRAHAVAVRQVFCLNDRQSSFSPFHSRRFSAGLSGQIPPEHAHALFHAQGHARQLDARGRQPVAEFCGLGHVQIVAL